MSDSPLPTFSIEKVYLKDLSVEVPNAPDVFLETEAPAMEVNINSGARAVQDGLYEVVLTVTITARIKEKTVFLVEVAQAGVFQIRNVPPEDIGPLLGIACPNTLFPYARETISTVNQLVNCDFAIANLVIGTTASSASSDDDLDMIIADIIRAGIKPTP